MIKSKISSCSIVNRFLKTSCVSVEKFGVRERNLRPGLELTTIEAQSIKYFLNCNGELSSGGHFYLCNQVRRQAAISDSSRRRQRTRLQNIISLSFSGVLHISVVFFMQTIGNVHQDCLFGFL